MRVRVKEPVHEHHLHVDLDHHARESSRVDAAGHESVHSRALDELQHQHALTRELVHDLGDHHARVPGEVRARFGRVLGLESEIHLFADARRALLHQRLEAEDVRRRPAARSPRGDRARRLQVLSDGQLDSRAQHFYRDIATVPTCAVYLAERGRRDRGLVDRVEDALRFHTVRGDDLRADRLPRDRGHLVGEPTEDAQVRLLNEVRARREHLRELHERRSQLRDPRDYRLGARNMERRRPLCWRPPPEPAVPVAEHRDDEWPEGEDDPERVHCG